MGHVEQREWESRRIVLGRSLAGEGSGKNPGSSMTAPGLDSVPLVPQKPNNPLLYFS